MKRLAVLTRLTVLLSCAMMAGCKQTTPAVSAAATAGDAARGQQLLARYGCAACHQIKDVAPGNNKTGPDLRGIADNSYIAGVLPNNPQNMLRWIMHPRAVSPGTAMPELGVSTQEANDMAAYLYGQ